MTVNWSYYRWQELDRDTLYDLLALRQKVFVVEQSCFYLDADGVDKSAIHLLGKNSQSSLVAYCRLYPQSDGWHVGRVLVSEAYRGKGLARALMLSALACCQRQQTDLPALADKPVHLSAQCHLVPFYHSLGFHSVGAAYDDDGIPHQDMSSDLVLSAMEGATHG